MSKTLGNGNTGKLVEQNHDDIWKVCYNSAEVRSFILAHNTEMFEKLDIGNSVIVRGKKNAKNFIVKPRHLGSRVYSLARLHMWKNMKRFDEVYYIDTDSLLIEMSEIDKIELDERKYGAFKIEERSTTVKIVSPKNYMIGDKKRCKGYRPGDKWTARKASDQSLIDEGTELTDETYDYLLDENVEVYTTFHKIEKKFVMKEGEGWRAFVVTGTETQRLLK